MERMTLREAAERSSRSITTLRRYIRSGRLHAEKRSGRYGPEYYVSEQDLREAGLEPKEARRSTALASRSSAGTETALSTAQATAGRPFDDSVPLSLYQDLQMKHEQLLVQYGMVRAGGLRVMELQSELETRQKRLDETESQVSRLRQELKRGASALGKRLAEAQNELEGRNLEIAALQEKVRALEMMTRNAVTNETIEKQFDLIKDQTRRVEELKSRRKWTTGERVARRVTPRSHGHDH
jgi:hypothetical protein